MRTLGLIGGMTWHSTVDYYRLVNEGVHARLGGAHSASLLLLSVDFDPVEALQRRGDWPGLGQRMADWARTLQAAGAEGLVICTNTMHCLADDVARAVSVPVLHIADATAAEARRLGIRRLGLLGTRYTMEQDFYRGRLERDHGLEVLVPEEPDRTLVHDTIYGELVHGDVREGSRRAFVAVIEALRDRGVEGVVLGCTEIPLLVRATDSPVPVLDTTALHARAAVEFALSG